MSRLQIAVGQGNTLITDDELFQEVMDFVGRNLGPEDTDSHSHDVPMVVQKLGDHLDCGTSAGVVIIWLALQLCGDLWSLPKWSERTTEPLLSGADTYILRVATKSANHGFLFPGWQGGLWKRIQLEMLQQYAMDRKCLGLTARGWIQIMVKISYLRNVLPWELQCSFKLGWTKYWFSIGNIDPTQPLSLTYI